MMARPLARKVHGIVPVVVFLTGLLLFVGLRQLASLWKYLSLAGILLSTAGLVGEATSYKDLIRLFDLKKLSGNDYYYLVISLLLGLLWGISFRAYLDLSLLPEKATLLALTAMLTGTAEEIIFRGYIQLKLRKMGIVGSVTAGSALHTFYKCFIFWILPPVYEINYLSFALWTFSMGCLLGWLKEHGHSTWVPVGGHDVFDLVVYGDKRINAWWFWM